MNKNISPEERLFRVIKEEKNIFSSNKELKEKKLDIFLCKAKDFLSRIKFQRNRDERELAGFDKIFGELQKIDIEFVNKALSILAVLVTVFTVYYVVVKRPSIAKITANFSKKKYSMKEKEEELNRTIKPLELYLSEVKKRNIFKFVENIVELPVVSKAEEDKQTFKDMIGELFLKGISWSEQPKVMIENKTDGKAYFLQEGQQIGVSGIYVKRILKDKVTLLYKNEELEL